MRQAFTLIELSIVLVIIGLIVGGVLVGQDLIKAAELRSVVSDIESHKTAFNTFRLKYNGIPGDIDNATTFWGKDNTNCSGHTGTAATPGTCNGDKDKQIDWALNGSGENYRAWQQLSMAGLAQGNLSGVPDGGEETPGVNIESSKISGGGYVLHWSGSIYGIPPSNMIQFASKDAGGSVIYGVVTSTDALSVDTKIDDGLADSGRTLAINGGFGGTAQTECLSGTSYDLTTTAKACRMLFYIK